MQLGWIDVEVRELFHRAQMWNLEASLFNP